MKSWGLGLLLLWTATVGMGAVFGSSAAIAQSSNEPGHITIEKAADLSPDEAERIYIRLSGLMAKRYSIADVAVANEYRNWMRFNSGPYLSASHGNRYVNNFANTIGEIYGALSKGIRFPTGTILVKDSFTVTDENKAFPGALFIMEKLTSEENPETGDWRYIGIFPDGLLIGDTMGFMPDRVGYCHQCHQSRADFDYVFGLKNAETAN